MTSVTYKNFKNHCIKTQLCTVPYALYAYNICVESWTSNNHTLKKKFFLGNHLHYLKNKQFKSKYTYWIRVGGGAVNLIQADTYTLWNVILFLSFDRFQQRYRFVLMSHLSSVRMLDVCEESENRSSHLSKKNEWNSAFWDGCSFL